MTRTWMAFGDSNTYGMPPVGDRRKKPARYGPGTRWPRAAQSDLGEGWELVEEGLPGRTAQFADPVMGAHMDGVQGLRIALSSHGPLDLLVMMLGTNDTKACYAATPERVTAGIAGLMGLAHSIEMLDRHPDLKVLLICPPPVVEGRTYGPEFAGAERVFEKLPGHYEALARSWGAEFLDAGQVIPVSDTDGVHFDAEAHRHLGQAVAARVEKL